MHGIVCGARNFFVGDKVVVTLPGAVLPGPFPIAARTTYGHVSDGMIASARELGLGDDHEGILRLSTLGIDAPVGTDAIALLGLNDAAVEINVTPDRGYAFSIRGVAREYAHATGARFRDPVEQASPVDASGDGFPVEIRDEAPIRGRVGSAVFATRIVRDVDPTRPTPAWMVARLKLAGIRSLSVLVDITNYVMLELGQPIHGYDLDQLRGGIVVRRATPGEKLVTLDGKERTLDVEDLVVTDDRGPIGLGGVMGGAETEMGDSTRNVLIEAANWDPVSIARTARRHKLPSEAAKRYERGVDPEIAATAVSRVAQLMVDLAGGTADIGGSLIHEAQARTAILLPDGYVSGLIGIEYTDDEVHDALAEIGGIVTRVGGGFEVVPPSWRPDLTGRAELAEEVARLAGYHRIPSVLPVAPPGRGLTRSQRIRRRVADTLAAAGSTEVLSFPFATEAENATFGSADGAPVASVRLANALDAGAALMRRSLAARAHRGGQAQPLAWPRRRLDLRARQRVPARGRPRLRDAGPARRRRATERRGPRDAAGGHPAAAPPRRRAHRRRRRDEAARPGSRFPPASSTPSTQCGRSHSPWAPTSRSCRVRTRRCTPAAPPSSGSPGAPSGTRANCCPRSRRRPTCRASSPSPSSTSTPSSRSPTRASRPARSAPTPPRRRTSRSWSRPTCRQRPWPTPCATVRASCSSTSSSSTTTGAQACPRARRASRSRCASARPTAR